MTKIKEWALWLWDLVKRLFGRSKIIFLQVVGLLATGFVELADPLAMFNWDSVVNDHAVALGIQIVVQMLTVFLRAYASNGPVNFRPLDPVPPVEPVEENPSPKAG